MVRSRLAQIGRDLGRALTEGAERTPLNPSGGDAWLALWAWSCLAVGLALLFACGYEAGFTGINGWASRYPTWMWQWITVLGDERVPLALSLFIAHKRPRVFWALMFGALAAVAFARGLKPLLDLPRPPALLDQEEIHLIGPALRRSSFPSGHSVSAGVFFGVLVYYGGHPLPRVLWVVMALLVGLSRVAVGVHWPLDVVFGLLIGVLAAWIGCRLSARWWRLAQEPWMHLACVAFVCTPTLSLTYWDGGYTLARPLLMTLGWGALAYAALVYGIGSLSSAWRQT